MQEDSKDPPSSLMLRATDIAREAALGQLRRQ